MKILLALMIAFLPFGSYTKNNFLEAGNSYLSKGEYKKAAKTFKAGIKAEPKNLIYQNQLGLTLIQQKQFKAAEKIRM